MSDLLTLPTRKDEAWRYSNLEALSAAWPVAAPEAVTVAAGESHSIAIIQDADDDAVIVRDYAIVLQAGSRLDAHVLNIGGKLGRVTFDVTLHNGAHFELAGAQIGGNTGAGDGQTLEIVTVVRHIEPEATSNQVVRTVLAGHATGNMLGRVEVARDAQLTDASQSVKAMLLDRTATANSKPELEIFADDVKCAHGATVGELDKAALFYCASRGLPPHVAQTLLLHAFVAEVFESVEGGEAMLEAALAKLETLG